MWSYIIHTDTKQIWAEWNNFRNIREWLGDEGNAMLNFSSHIEVCVRTGNRYDVMNECDLSH